MRYLQILAAGDFGLVKTFWIFGVFVVLVTNSISEFVSLEIHLLITGALLIYLFFLVPGIWRAADRYEGRFSVAPILAKIYAVLLVCFTFLTGGTILTMIA